MPQKGASRTGGGSATATVNHHRVPAYLLPSFRGYHDAVVLLLGQHNDPVLSLLALLRCITQRQKSGRRTRGLKGGGDEQMKQTKRKISCEMRSRPQRPYVVLAHHRDDHGANVRVLVDVVLVVVADKVIAVPARPRARAAMTREKNKK